MDVDEGGTDSSIDHLLIQREKYVGKALSIAHEKPLHIIRGDMQYLYSADGEKYLDLVNNVCHVGHSNPRVVEAGQRQMALLNTNTRYIYKVLTQYIERLARTLPSSLNVGYLVNSGSEANELAVRIARSFTGEKNMIVMEGAYHGHTTMLIDLSPYKFRGPGGKGKSQPWVHVVPIPDAYRRKGENYAKELAGKPATFEVEIKELQESVPASIDDELAKNLGLQNIEELKTQIKESHEREFEAICRMRLKRQLLDLLDKSDIQFPGIKKLHSRII